MGYRKYADNLGIPKRFHNMLNRVWKNCNCPASNCATVKVLMTILPPVAVWMTSGLAPALAKE